MTARSTRRICNSEAPFTDERCTNCVVRGALARGGSRDDRLTGVLLRIQSFTFPAGRQVYAQDAPAAYVYALRAGTLKLVRREPGASPRTVRWMRANSTAGLEALLEARYRHSAVALEPVVACLIPLSVLRHLERAGRPYYLELLRRWQSDLDAADGFVALLGPGAAEQRLARLLLALCETECPSLPRSDLGAALGVSKETASRLMAAFRRRGLIRRANSRQLACDAPGLRALARAEPSDS